jgi:hypothetical protein
MYRVRAPFGELNVRKGSYHEMTAGSRRGAAALRENTKNGFHDSLNNQGKNTPAQSMRVKRNPVLVQDDNQWLRY